MKMTTSTTALQNKYVVVVFLPVLGAEARYKAGEMERWIVGELRDRRRRDKHARNIAEAAGPNCRPIK